MDNEVLTLWDAPIYGEKIFFDVFNCLQKEKKINSILYLYCEQNFTDNDFRQCCDPKKPDTTNSTDHNTKERIQYLEEYFKNSSVTFKSLKISNRAIPEGEADNIPKIQNAIVDYVFPELLNLNPSSLHITLASGTREMIFAWISLYATSRLTRAFGNEVYLWHFSDDRTKRDDKFKKLYQLDVPKNQFIEAIELSEYENTDNKTVELDIDNDIRRNCIINAPMLLLGERGIGKSTIVETTIYSEKLKQGLIKNYGENKNIQTIVCGQLENDIVDSELFGHKKGAYTGAMHDKTGAIEASDGGILFLDEIQDLPKATQRKLLRVLQTHKFSRLGEPDKEKESNFQLVCASNKSLSELQEKLDADFFDRIAVFITKLPPLRELPSPKIEELWKNRWNHCRRNKYILPEKPDDFELVKDTLISSGMYGNIRDIEQLIAYIARDVYQGTPKKSENARKTAYIETLAKWKQNYNEKYSDRKIINENFSKDLLEKEKWEGMNKMFKKWLAEESEKIFGSQINAAKTMECEPKTLRNAKSSDLSITTT